MWDIREGVVGADTFIPKHVVIMTWKNVSFAGGIDISLYKVCAIIDVSYISEIGLLLLSLYIAFELNKLVLIIHNIKSEFISLCVCV